MSSPIRSCIWVGNRSQPADRRGPAAAGAGPTARMQRAQRADHGHQEESAIALRRIQRQPGHRQPARQGAGLHPLTQQAGLAIAGGRRQECQPVPRDGVVECLHQRWTRDRPSVQHGRLELARRQPIGQDAIVRGQNKVHGRQTLSNNNPFCSNTANVSATSLCTCGRGSWQSKRSYSASTIWSGVCCPSHRPQTA